MQDFCLQLHFHHCVSVVTHLLTPQRSSSVILSLATSPIISAHSTIKHTASYKWPNTEDEHSGATNTASWDLTQESCTAEWVGRMQPPGAGTGTGTETPADPNRWSSNTTTRTQLWDRYFSTTCQETVSSRLDIDMILSLNKTRETRPISTTFGSRASAEAAMS